MRQETAKEITKADLTQGDHEDHQLVETKMALCRRVRQEFAAAIIAGGVFNQNDLQTGVISALAETDSTLTFDMKSLDEFFGRRGVDARIPSSSMSDIKPDSTDFASDVAKSIAYRWAEHGFLVGLAVGMQLGPHAFDGGAR